MKKKTILLILALVCLLALSAAAAACGHTPQPQGTSPDAGTSSVPADPAESSPSALDDPAVPENSQSAEAPAPSADPTEESPETGASAPAEGSDAEPVEESGKPAKEESREEKPVSEDPAPPVSQDPVSEPADPVYSEEIQFLTRQTFSSSRVKKDVSQAFRSGYAQTALNLLKQSANGKGALISPLSILTALQMTANGAKGRTLEEMQAVLCGMDTEDLNQQLFNYYEGLENTEDASLNVSNAIWLTSRTDFHVNPDFIGLMNNTFRAQIATAPLHMPSTVDAINGWCRTNTDNMIEKILEYDDVDESTTMILLNALCFEALWSEQYQDYQCRKAEFHGETETTEVTMMYSEEYGYISGANETGFVKRYEGEKYAFVALLPNEGMSMSEYLATLTGERFLSLVDERKGAVDAGLPKFTFDWSDSLVPALQKLGMVTVFTGQSDLSGLGYYDDDAPLYISDVIHKTHIEVEESGTKAAAVTAVIVNKATAVNPAEIKKVILDRPFIYAIVDTATNLPVFLGCVTDLPAA